MHTKVTCSDAGELTWAVEAVHRIDSGQFREVADSCNTTEDSSAWTVSLKSFCECPEEGFYTRRCATHGFGLRSHLEVR